MPGGSGGTDRGAGPGGEELGAPLVVNIIYRLADTTNQFDKTKFAERAR